LSHQQRAELLQGDEGIVKTYEARKAELEKTIADLETNQRRLDEIKESLTGKQDEWRRNVLELVNNMDMHFQLFLERFKCAGKLELRTEGVTCCWLCRLRGRVSSRVNAILCCGFGVPASKGVWLGYPDFLP
jgi:hypothetical protein